MESFTVEKHNHKIECYAGRKALNELSDLAKGKKCFLLADSACYKQHRGRIRGVKLLGKYVLNPENEDKTLETVQDVLNRLHSSDADRETLLLVFGGGKVQDIGAIVALLYRRGISYVSIPSTPLSAFDGLGSGSAVLDLNSSVLSLGATNYPLAILADIEVLQSVSEKNALSGLGGAFCLSLFSEEFLDYLEDNYEKVLRLETEATTKVLQYALPLKSQHGKDALFGSTLATAFLSSGEYALSYGEAVLYGLYFESLIAEKITGELLPIYSRVRENVLNFFRKQPLLTGSYTLLSVIKKDEKSVNGEVILLLPTEEFTVKELRIPERAFIKAVEELEYGVNLEK